MSDRIFVDANSLTLKITRKIKKPLNLSEARENIRKNHAWPVQANDPELTILVSEIGEKNRLFFLERADRCGQPSAAGTENNHGWPESWPDLQSHSG
jgi:hypothetical protein